MITRSQARKVRKVKKIVNACKAAGTAENVSDLTLEEVIEGFDLGSEFVSMAGIIDDLGTADRDEINSTLEYYSYKTVQKIVRGRRKTEVLCICGEDSGFYELLEKITENCVFVDRHKETFADIAHIEYNGRAIAVAMYDEIPTMWMTRRTKKAIIDVVYTA